MKKRNLSMKIGAALVGIAFGTIGVLSTVNAASAMPAIVGRNIAHDNGGNSDKSKHLGHIAKDFDDLATILKLTSTELKTQLKSGKTLAEIATAQKVDVSLLVNSIVARIKAHIAEEVADGDMTQAQADTKIAGLTTMVTDMVNGIHPAHGVGRGHGRGMHMPLAKTGKNSTN